MADTKDTAGYGPSKGNNWSFLWVVAALLLTIWGGSLGYTPHKEAPAAAGHEAPAK